MTSLLRFEDVTLERSGRLLFERLNLALGAGEALQVAGPNGSGKSSLIRLAAGLLRQSSGLVKRCRLALVDDRAALDRELPLGRALAFWGSANLCGCALAGAVERLGLAPLADVPVRLLSTGQLKRAMLARVAASQTPLWLLDEPLNGLDPAGAEALIELINSHRAAGGAVLAASHVPLSGEWQRLELQG